MVERNLIEGRCSTCLATADKSLNGTDILCVYVSFLLVLQEFLNFFVLRLDNLILLISKELIKAVDEVHETYNFLITYSDVTRCLVCYMNVMSLLYQTTKCTTH